MCPWAYWPGYKASLTPGLRWHDAPTPEEPAMKCARVGLTEIFAKLLTHMLLLFLVIGGAPPPLWLCCRHLLC